MAEYTVREMFRLCSDLVREGRGDDVFIIHEARSNEAMPLEGVIAVGPSPIVLMVDQANCIVEPEQDDEDEEWEEPEDS